MSKELEDAHMIMHCTQLILNENQIKHNNNENIIVKELLKRITELEGHIEFILTSEKGIYKE